MFLFVVFAKRGQITIYSLLVNMINVTPQSFDLADRALFIQLGNLGGKVLLTVSRQFNNNSIFCHNFL